MSNARGNGIENVNKMKYRDGGGGKERERHEQKTDHEANNRKTRRGDPNESAACISTRMAVGIK